MPEKDDVLAALNGDMPPLVDEAPAVAPERDRELSMDAPQAKPAIQRADDVHSTSKGGSGYRLRVQGEYYATDPNSPKGKTRKPYDLFFNVPKLEGAPSQIKNKLLPLALRKKHPDAVRHRTMRVVESVPLNANTPKSRNLAYADRAALEQYVRSSEPAIPLDLESFPGDLLGTTALRESIIDYVQNPKDFQKREEERARIRREDAELMAANPELAS